MMLQIKTSSQVQTMEHEFLKENFFHLHESLNIIGALKTNNDFENFAKDCLT